MLEAIRERAQGWVAKLILALIAVTFAIFGIDSYFSPSSEGEIVATIGSNKITKNDWLQRINERAEQLAANSSSTSVDKKIIQDPAFRRSVLEDLINEKLLSHEAAETNFQANEQEIGKTIAAIPAFHSNGQFSLNKYEILLKQNGLTPAMFEARLHQDYIVQQIKILFSESSFVPNSAVNQFIQLYEQRRLVSEFHLSPNELLKRVSVTPVEINDFYQKNLNIYTIPEQFRVQYLILSTDGLIDDVQVTQDEIINFYQKNAAQLYKSPEERVASHILISITNNGKKAVTWEQAFSKAQTVYNEAKENPGNFAELAKKFSDDLGSASQGGDLGSISRGTMVKPFEDALFAMAKGEISKPIKTEFGYHVIKLEDIKPGAEKPLQEVQGEIASNLGKQKISSKFAKYAETFSNIVYEQADSLRPAAEALNLKIQTTDWISSTGPAPAPFNNETLREALVSSEVLEEGRNTEAVEVAPNTLVAARIVERKPAFTQPLVQLQTQIREKLLRVKADALAVKLGNEYVSSLQRGESVPLEWSPAKLISRSDAQKMGEEAAQTMFRADVTKLPVYTGTKTPSTGGYTLYMITDVSKADDVTESKRKEYREQLRPLYAQRDFNAYLQGLREGAEIKIFEDNLTGEE